MRCPAGPTTSTTPGPSGSECGTMGAPATSTGMNAGPGNGNASLATPSRSSVRRQRYTSDVHTRCRRATSNTLAPGIIASDTIRALSSSLNRRRGSGPTISIIRVAMMPHRCLPQCRTCGLRITSSARWRRPDAYRERTGATKESIEVGKEKSRKGRPQVNVTAADIASVQLEFGNQHQTAEPFARPAKDAKQGEILNRFGDALKHEVDQSVIRAAKRAAKG